MEIVLVECPNDRRVVIAGRTLVYAEDAHDPTACNATYDAEFIAEALARAAGVGVRVHRVGLPDDFAVWDEDGPLPSFKPEDAVRWWVNLCEAQAEEAAMASPPPAYPTLAEQVLGVVAAAGMEITDGVRRLAAELETAAVAGTGSGR